jgi:hypothetical protein
MINLPKRGDAFTKRYGTCLFEDDDVIVTATYSSHKQFDAKLLGVDVIGKAF